MTKLLLLTLPWFTLQTAFAQYEWFNNYSGAGYVSVSKLAADQDGNLFSVGNFESTVTLGTTTYQGGGAFLMKVDNAGKLIWTRRFTFASLDFFSIVHVKTDPAGNVYTVGQYPQSANVGGVAISGNSHNSYLAKFNNDGELLWIKTFIGLQEIFYLSVNATGDIGISGVFYAPSLSIDAITLSTTKPFASFGAVFNTGGLVQWAQVFSSNNTFSDFPMAITLDDGGNYFISHRFSGAITVGSNQFSSNGNFNLFIIKINNQGQLSWFKEIARLSPYTANITELGELTVDQYGDLYACGGFWMTYQVDNINITDNSGSNYTNNRFVSKLSGADGQIEWVTPTLGELDGYTTENILIRGERVYVSGLVEGNPYYQILNAGQGTPTQEPKIFPFRGDIANGLQVNAEGMIFMSGRRRNPELTGYIFKVNMAGEITTEAEICSTDSFQATVTPIEGATTYEWEVTYNSMPHLFETSEPFLEIPASALAGVTELFVRVRGKNDLQSGNFAPTKNVTIVSPSEVPLIKSNCDGIELVQGSNIEWYTEEEGKLTYPQNTTSIKAEYGLNYFALETNVCGNQQSNVIEFNPIFIPNIITPNGDYKNEMLRLDERLSQADLTIFDRWGKIIFNSNNYQNNWNGGDLSPGVYYFTVEHPCLSYTYKSALSIVK